MRMAGLAIAVFLFTGPLSAADPAPDKQHDYDAAHDPDPANVPGYRPVHLAGNVYLLTGGEGSNVTVCAGKEDILVVDDQFASLSVNLIAAIRKISDKPIRFVVNTHFHSDHTGGNQNFADQGAIIIAHDNTLKRLSTEQRSPISPDKIPPRPAAAWPKLTIAQAGTVHACDSTVELRYVGPAHTDTDLTVHFVEADVYDMGDIYLSEIYPYFDQTSNGNFDGIIRVITEYSNKTDARSIIVPGHGHISDRNELRAYKEMLVTVRGRFAAAIREGKSLQEVEALNLTRDLDARWTNSFMTPKLFADIAYASLSGK